MEENETPEFETKPAVNKDVWLLLIILDVVAMGVLGFYLYKHFAPQFAKQNVSPVMTAQAAVVPEDVSTIASVAVVEEEPDFDVVPAAQPATPAPAPKTLVEEALESVEAQQPAPAEEVTPAQEETKPAAEKKQSIIVTQGKSTKYRQVTFRWFGAGKSVAVVSGFTGSQPRKLQKKKDYWETTLAIAPGSYKFLYVVDGVNKVDPYAEQKDGRSLLEVK